MHFQFYMYFNRYHDTKPQKTSHTGVTELLKYCIVIGQNWNWTASPQRQERKRNFLNAFPLPVRLGVQLYAIQ